MIAYKRLDPKSGVTHYRVESDQIFVKFQNGVTFVYSAIKPGKVHVDRMKELASAGKGLNTYINVFLKDGHSRKF